MLTLTSTKRIKELVTARKELTDILSQKEQEDSYPSKTYIDQIIQSINHELENLEQKQKIGLFISFSSLELGIFFLLTFTQFSDLLSKRILGQVDQGGYGFWEGFLEPIAFRIILILVLTIISVSATLKLLTFFKGEFRKRYYQTNILLIVLFNIITILTFITAWWGLVWIDRLTSWV